MSVTCSLTILYTYNIIHIRNTLILHIRLYLIHNTLILYTYNIIHIYKLSRVQIMIVVAILVACSCS